MFKKLLFVFAVLLFFCGFAAAQTEMWGGLGINYALVSTSTTTRNLVAHGAGLSARFFVCNQKAKAGFYANVSLDYIFKRNQVYSGTVTASGLEFPVDLHILLAPLFKFSLSKSIFFYIAPGIHAAVMPEFAFGAGADAGFNFQIGSRFFMGLGVVGSFNFVGVNFFEGGNLKRYSSFSASPYISLGWRSIR